MMNKFICFIFLFSASQAQKYAAQKGSLDCKGGLKADTVSILPTGELKTEKAKFKSVDIGDVEAKKTLGNSIITSQVNSNNNKNEIFINSALKVEGELSYQQTGASSLDIDNVYIGEKKQWKRVKIKNKDLDKVNHDLNSKKNKKEVKHTIKVLDEEEPSHYKVEMSVEYELGWKGTSYIMVNEEIYWMEEGPEGWRGIISFVIPSKFIQDKEIELTFGVKTLKSSKGKIYFNELSVLIK